MKDFEFRISLSDEKDGTAAQSIVRGEGGGEYLAGVIATHLVELGGNCQVLFRPAASEDQIEAAHHRYYSEGDDQINVDNDALVSESDDHGAWVSAWVWIDTCDKCGAPTDNEITWEVEWENRDSNAGDLRVCDDCEGVTCRACGEDNPEGGEGWDGMCGDCADKYGEKE